MTELVVTLDSGNLRRLRTLATASKLTAAKSLTFTAEKAQFAWRAGHSLFHRRNNWLDKGVRIAAATRGNLNARVGTLDRFFGRHVRGIEDRKVGNLFVPAYGEAREVPTHSKIRARLRAMRNTKRKPFERNGMLLRREGAGGKAPLKVLGFLRSKVKIEPRFDAQGIVERTVQAEYPRVYERLLLKWSETGRV